MLMEDCVYYGHLRLEQCDVLVPTVTVAGRHPKGESRAPVTIVTLNVTARAKSLTHTRTAGTIRVSAVRSEAMSALFL